MSKYFAVKCKKKKCEIFNANTFLILYRFHQHVLAILNYLDLYA